MKNWWNAFAITVIVFFAAGSAVVGFMWLLQKSLWFFWLLPVTGVTVIVKRILDENS